MYTFLLIVHSLVAMAVIGLVLIQHGRGADAGAAFGSGASGTLFGSRGPTSFLARTTTVLAAVFFVTSLSLAYLASQSLERRTIMERVPVPEEKSPPQEGESSAPPSGEIPTAPPEEGGGFQLPPQAPKPAAPETPKPAVPVDVPSVPPADHVPEGGTPPSPP